MDSIPGAVGCQVLGVATQGACVFTMAWCRRVHAVSLNIIHDTDRLVLVGNELVVFPLTDGRMLWLAGVSRGTGVHCVAVNSAMEAEGRLFTFTLLQRFSVWVIACG